MQDSMYASYIKERTFDHILETDEGFATYRYLEDGRTVYIVDIYVKPEFRQSGHAARMADTIVKEAREKLCHTIVGTVIPNTRGATKSLKVLLGYGMDLHSADKNIIIFRKDI